VKLISILVGVAVALTPAVAADKRERPKTPQRVKLSCIGDRCAIYTNGRRTGSVTDDGRRYTVRDSNNRVVARVSVEDE
jgi:hypothetical protein